MKIPLEHLCAALIPPGGKISPGAGELEVPQEIEALARQGDRVSELLVRSAAWSLEFSAFFSPKGRRLSSLSPDEAADHVVSLSDKGGMLGSSVQLLRHLIEASYTAHPPIRSALGVGPAPTSDLGPPPPPLPVLPHASVGVKVRRECDVCIVGTGAGGAPAAKVLAAAGLKVLFLEEGGAYNRADFSGPPLQRMARHYRGGGLLTTLGRPIVSVVEAMAVGGTTVFNSGSCFRPPPEVVRQWSRDLHLPSLTPESLAPYLDRAEQTLGVGTPTWDILGGNARTLKDGAIALHHPDHGIIPRPAPGCRGSDECVIGCPRDAKRSMALSYVPQALALGAQIMAGATVHRIRREGGSGGSWVVAATLRDPRTQVSAGTLEVRARYVVVAAGALHTPLLLPRVGDRSSRGHRGRHLRLHPSFEVAGEMPQEVKGWEGVLQSYFVRESDERILLEATFQPRGILSTAGLLPVAGQAYKEYLPSVSRWAIVGGMVSEDTEGKLIAETSGRPWMLYDLLASDVQRIHKAMLLSARLLFSAGARKVFLPVGGGRVVDSPGDLDRLPVPERDKLHLFAFHPLGTARMAGDPELGAVDERGIVWGTEGLGVSDASILPGSPHVNPMISIIALAERNAELWQKEWKA